MTRIILSAVGSFLAASLLNKLMIPVLRALKAGQSIREVGPTWHNGKSGTPIMGGLMFIAAAVLCLLAGYIAGRRPIMLLTIIPLALVLLLSVALARMEAVLDGQNKSEQ